MQSAPPAINGPAELTRFLEVALREERDLLQRRHSELLATLRRAEQRTAVLVEQPEPAVLAESKCLTDFEQNCSQAAPVEQHEPAVQDESECFTDFDQICPQEPREMASGLQSDPNQLVSPAEDTTGFARKKSRLNDVFTRKEVWSMWILFQPSQLVKSANFELFFAAMILANCTVMALESQYNGLDIGYEIGYKNFKSPGEQMWPGASATFETLEFVFGLFFMLELLIKVAGLRREFTTQIWNWFDTCLVVFWLLDTSLQSIPVDGSLLRLIRLARLFRLVRLARAMRGFDSLVVMTTALQGSISALFWVAVILLIVQMMFALLLSQILTELVKNSSFDDNDRLKVFEYFGTFSRAILTMFELTLGNWVPVARILQEHVSGLFVVFSILHKVSLGFACIGVINGVFMQETFKVTKSDDAMLMREAEKIKETHIHKMTEFLKHSDVSGDGKISEAEWKDCLNNEHVHNWFAGQGLSLCDADRLFRHLEVDGDGKLSPEELVEGVSRLQGTAKSLDLTFFKEDIFKLLESRIGELDCKMSFLEGVTMSTESFCWSLVSQQEKLNRTTIPPSPDLPILSQEQTDIACTTQRSD